MVGISSPATTGRRQMRRTTILRVLLMIVLIVAGRAIAAYAFPPIPHHFTGSVKIDESSTPDGTVISAWVESMNLATTQTLSAPPGYGNSVYSIVVPGDDPDTAQIEGAYPGATIRFCLGSPCSVWADQQGVWQSGGLSVLDLTATTATPEPGSPRVFLPVITAR